MKFKKLTIRNINSIESAELDFENSLMKNEPIFLIHGETGSGKSTILDAICLALYKTTPRLNGTQSIRLDDETYKRNVRGGEPVAAEMTTQDPRQYMRRGITQKDEAYAELLFEGNDGNDYTARIEFGIGRQMALSDIKWTLRLPTGEVLTRDNNIKPVILAQVGLDFQQFCRTTLLAQGEFTKFLKADAKDKADILEKITQTDIYSAIGIRISERTSQEKSKLDTLRTEENTLSGGLMSNEQLAKAENQAGILTAKNATLKGLGAMWEGQKQWLTDFDTAMAEREVKQNQHNTLKQRRDKPEFKQCEELARLWHAAENERHAYTEAERLKRQIKENSSELEQLKVTAAKLLSATQNIMHETDRINASINEYSQKETGQKQRYETLNNEIGQINFNELTSSQTLLNARKFDALQLKKCSAELRQKQDEENDTTKKLNETTKEKEQHETALAELTEQRKQTDAALKAAKEEYEKISLAIGNYAKSLRAKLNEGDKCPVCGQKVDSVQRDEEFEIAVKPYRDNIEVLQQKQDGEAKLHNDLTAKIKGCEATISTYNNSLKNTSNDITSLKGSQAQLCGRLGINPDDDIDKLLQDIDKLLNDIESRLTEIEPQIKHYNLLVQERQNANQELKTITNNLTNLRARLVSLKHILDTADTSAADLPNDWKTQQPHPANIVESELENRWTRLAQDYKVSISNANQLNARRHEHEKILTNSVLPLDKIKELANYTPDYITRIETEQQKIKEDIDRSKGELDNLNNHIVELEQRRPAIADGDTAQKISDRLIGIRATIDNNNRSHGTIIQQITAHHTTLSRVAEIKQKAELQQKVYEQWKELSDIFGGKDNPKFRAIAQSFVMRELLHHANKYMAEFMPRYQLECKGDNLVVQLRDRYCNGQLRNFATASGGESFVVSLALALGLMSLGDQAINVDTLFIDEGFGSLDAETLETVVDTLGKLHDINHRRVGIISHVDSLKERIAARITLQKAKNSNVVTGLRIE